MKDPNLHWRDRIGMVLRDNRRMIAAELLVLTILQVLHALQIISAAVIYIFAIGWFSLWLRRSGWRQLGLRRPANWPATIGFGTVAGLVYQAVSIWLVVPWLSQLTNEPLDLTQFAPLEHNLPLLILWLTITWTVAAFAEELVYRGYLLNRVADLFGQGRAGWAIGLIGSSALFGCGHAYQGITGILETFLFGCLMAGLYLTGRRNLWLPIIAHGVYNSAAFVLIFLGLVP